MGQLWAAIPEPYSFDPDADITGVILHTLNGPRPEQTIADTWPWMRGDPAVADFVDHAKALRDNRDVEELTLRIERFAYVILVCWREDAEQARRPWWRRR